MNFDFARRDVLTMRWADVLFAHWAAPAETVAERLPAGVSVATYDGEAWLGIVAKELQNVRLRGVPFGRTFGTVNLLTYVERDGDRGVHYFSLDAGDELSATAARLGFRLPFHAADVDVRRRDGEIRFTSHRVHRGARPAHFDADYRPVGERRNADPGSFESFFAENYYFVTGGRGGLYRGDVHHGPLPLCDVEAELRSTTLLEASDFDRPNSDPLVHYSPGVDVRATPIRRVA